MTSQAGVAPDDNWPSGLNTLPGFAVQRAIGDAIPTADSTYDLERMLAVLRTLPDLHGVRESAERYLGPAAEPIEVALELELDTAAPHLDLVRQLARQIERILTHRGVVVGRAIVELLDRVAAQARSACPTLLAPLPGCDVRFDVHRGYRPPPADSTPG